ncbi:hypothetical protein Godav_021885 [Gossypium davidsonii]|uniref:Aminotransferase-like plant mobile domain-containing protein n=1 Tax=Gossypium davidsonii TaxID=34287 RepID=A0A7J8TFZ5_GOSDV|nr:hypothetical protein [Gossypium davidsonii]
MARQLIRLDDKHISVDQMQMPVDRVLQCFIRNLPGPPSPLIKNYLRKAGFWHVANIGQGCKLDPKFISAFVERWKPEKHTFHLLCEGCTITLKDVQLQLGLLAYILKILGCYLMPDKSRDLVHLRWLLKLIDFRVTSKLSWGSVVLATLY